MSLIRKSASERIDFFFERYTHTSKTACDSVAAKITNSSMEPTSTQGAFSYTVIGTSQVVHFRAKISPLDTRMIKLAKKIHGEFVASTTQWGLFDDNCKDEHQVVIYCMERLPGNNYSVLDMFTRLTAPQLERQIRTMEGLAKQVFFAQAWLNSQIVSQAVMGNTYSMYIQRLATLEKCLPSQYTNLVKHCQKNLDSLFNYEIPWVLTHGDLCDTNLLVDPNTGQLSGIADWAEAEILPFGLSLWGIHTLLGFMDEKEGRWIYFSDYKYLEQRFWLFFENAVVTLNNKQRSGVKIGSLLGLLCRHGFKFNCVESIPKDESWDLSLLKGQLLEDEGRWLEVP